MPNVTATRDKLNNIINSINTITGTTADNITTAVTNLLNSPAYDLGAANFIKYGKIKYNNDDSITFYTVTNPDVTALTVHPDVTHIGYLDSDKGPCEGLTKLITIKLPDGLLLIGDKAFKDCSSLQSITIPDSVETIRQGTFNGCSSMSSITIPFTGESKDVVYSADSLFCTIFGDKTADVPESLKTVVITSGNTEYDKNGNISNENVIIADAFANCKNIESVILPDNLTSINERAFKDCAALNSITIPDCITQINSNTFEGCTKLENVTIGNSVSIIYSDAFKGCSSLTEIKIPDKVTAIFHGAFCNCTSLNKITLGAKVNYISPHPLYQIGDDNLTSGIFVGCPITSIIVDENNQQYKSLDGNLYYDDDLTTEQELTLVIYAIGKQNESFEIPSSVKSIPVTAIDGYAFYKCSALKNVTIPNSVTTINDHAFDSCYGLVNVSIEGGGPLNRIGLSAFLDCANLKSITIPDGVVSIGSEAFRGCSNLKSITIPDSVTSIGEDPLYDSVFRDCSNLESVTLSNNITNISGNMFEGCSKLTNVTIPNKVEKIEYGAFARSGIESVTIPNSVKKIESNVFAYCNNLKKLIYNGTSAQWNAIEKRSDWYHDTSNFYIECTDVLFDKDGRELPVLEITHTSRDLIGYTESTTELVIPKIVEDNTGALHMITSIGAAAFASCENLTSITIPESVTSIGESAFSWCDALTSVTIGDSVTTLGDYAFFACSSLKSITIPGSVTSIGYGVFTSINHITFEGTSEEWLTITKAQNWYQTASDFTITCSNGDLSSLIECPITNINRELTGYKGEANEELTIPEIAYDNYGNKYRFTSISDQAFANCSKLTSIAIPSSIISIGTDAFADCYLLRSVHITDLAAWCSISFSNYRSNPLYYTAELYLNDNLLDEFTIPDSVTNIGNYAFYNCKIGRITIPDSVTSIGDYAFAQGSMRRITIPTSVINIGQHAFQNCLSLISITYNDTSACWNAITKGSNWALAISDCVIYCTDSMFCADNSSIYETFGDITIKLNFNFNGEIISPLYYIDESRIDIWNDALKDFKIYVQPGVPGFYDKLYNLADTLRFELDGYDTSIYCNEDVICTQQDDDTSWNLGCTTWYIQDEKLLPKSFISWLRANATIDYPQYTYVGNQSFEIIQGVGGIDAGEAISILFYDENGAAHHAIFTEEAYADGRYNFYVHPMDAGLLTFGTDAYVEEGNEWFWQVIRLYAPNVFANTTYHMKTTLENLVDSDHIRLLFTSNDTVFTRINFNVNNDTGELSIEYDNDEVGSENCVVVYSNGEWLDWNYRTITPINDAFLADNKYYWFENNVSTYATFGPAEYVLNTEYINIPSDSDITGWNGSFLVELPVYVNGAPTNPNMEPVHLQFYLYDNVLLITDEFGNNICEVIDGVPSSHQRWFIPESDLEIPQSFIEWLENNTVELITYDNVRNHHLEFNQISNPYTDDPNWGGTLHATFYDENGTEYSGIIAYSQAELGDPYYKVIKLLDANGEPVEESPDTLGILTFTDNVYIRISEYEWLWENAMMWNF
jgi:hypothetical protein